MQVTKATVIKWNIPPNPSLTTGVRLPPLLFVRETNNNITNTNIPTIRQNNRNSKQNVIKEIWKVTIVTSKLPHNPFRVQSNDSMKKEVNMHVNIVRN